MRPNLPRGEPSEPFPEEPPTGKLSVIAEAREKCPACGGKVLIELEPVDPGPLDVHRYGVFRATVCLFCAESSGVVTATEAETIRAAIAKK